METTKHTPTMTYEDGHGCLFVTMDDGKRYGLAQTSGELKFTNPIAFYYWSDIDGKSPEKTQELFRLIVEAVNSFDSLRTALKTLADDAHAMLNVLPACTGNAAAMAHVLSTSIDKARAALGGE